MCITSFFDLFRKGYHGVKSDFWLFIPRWSSGSVVWPMIIGLGFYFPTISFKVFWSSQNGSFVFDQIFAYGTVT